MSIKITSEYLELLNQAVAREFQVAIQYFLQHAKMEKILRKVKPENILLEKTTYDAIGDILKDFAIQEMKHAGEIMERIFYLGGEATSKSEKPKIGDSLTDFAKHGVEAEEEALVLYRKIIEKAIEIGDWETRQIFERIYGEEEEHFFKFEEFLKFDDSEPEGPEAYDSEWTKILTDDYFGLLNKAVAAEISAIIQYVVQHEKANFLALRKKNTPLEAISDTNKTKVVSEILKKTALQEMEHLEKISERIYLLGGECVFNPDPLPIVGDNADDFLKLDHKAEDEAIVLYKEIIAEAFKRGDTTTRRIFEDIVMEEDEHYWTFDDFF